MHKSNTTFLFWGILHGVNDWVAGYMLAAYALKHEQQQSMFALILYAVLAFGGQLPAGLWLDRYRKLEAPGMMSMLLLLSAGVLFFIDPLAAIIVSGVASAGIHVVGGTVCLMENREKITPLGIFTAPGVAGLTLGGFCGSISVVWMVFPVLIITVLLFLIKRKGLPAFVPLIKEHATSLGVHDMLMLALLLLMTLRSFLFDLVNSFSGQFENGLLIIGLSAFAGKLLSGFFADRIGWKRWVFITLPLAWIFLQLGHNNVVMMAFGVACLQSSVPITLQLMYNSMPSWPATATAMSLGAIVAFAGLPLYAAPQLHLAFRRSDALFYSLIAGILLLLAAGIWWFSVQYKRMKTAG